MVIFCVDPNTASVDVTIWATLYIMDNLSIWWSFSVLMLTKPVLRSLSEQPYVLWTTSIKYNGHFLYWCWNRQCWGHYLGKLMYYGQPVYIMVIFCVAADAASVEVAAGQTYEVVVIVCVVADTVWPVLSSPAGQPGPPQGGVPPCPSLSAPASPPWRLPKRRRH